MLSTAHCDNKYYLLTYIKPRINQYGKSNFILVTFEAFGQINLFLVMLKGDVSKLTHILSSWAVTTDLLDDIPKISLKTVRSVE